MLKSQAGIRGELKVKASHNLTPTAKRILKAKAKREGCSVSELIERFARNELPANDAVPTGHAFVGANRTRVCVDVYSNSPIDAKSYTCCLSQLMKKRGFGFVNATHFQNAIRGEWGRVMVLDYEG